MNPIPGQEERNADHLLQAGAAIRGNNLPALALPALAWKLDRLLDDAARLEAMRKNARRLSRPGAAAEIVSELAWGSSPAGFRPGETGA